MTIVVPPLKMPPPQFDAVMPERVELERVRAPELAKPPPLPEILAPETVTPETVKLPPETILKIVKLPWLASMVSAEAPGPVMTSEPAVLAFTISGSADARVIV